MNFLLSLVACLSGYFAFAEAPSRSALILHGASDGRPPATAIQISQTSPTLFLIQDSNGKRGPLVKSFPGWKTKEGTNAKAAIDGLQSWREKSKMHPGMETDTKNPGLGAVMNGIEFRPAKEGGMEAVFYGEFNGVRVPVNAADLDKLNSGKTVTLRFVSEINKYLYVVGTDITMTVRLNGSHLEIDKTSAKMNFTHNPASSFLGISKSENYQSPTIESPPLRGSLSTDAAITESIRGLNILN